MRAIGVFVHGGPEVLEVVDLPEVHAGAGQVRVRVHAAAVNPTDTMVRNGSRAEQQKVDPPPYVPGSRRSVTPGASRVSTTRSSLEFLTVISSAEATVAQTRTMTERQCVR